METTEKFELTIPINDAYHTIHHNNTLYTFLKQRIYGQDDAILAIMNQLEISASGLGSDTKPVGSFLFMGPTGVGKTELAKELASGLKYHFVRFDMSEFMDERSVSNLIGSARGLVGSEEGGLLTNAISKHPHCVLLLDEIEKADAKVLHLLLQVLDYGQLKDTQGRKVDFKNTIIILTSNVGATEKATVGFHSNNHSNRLKALENLLSPEMLSRIDHVIHFNSLNQPMMEEIVKKFLATIQYKLFKKQIIMTYNSRILDFLADCGLQQQQGARGVSKMIDTHILLPLSQILSKQKPSKESEIYIDYKEGAFSFTLSCSKTAVSNHEPKDGLWFECWEEACVYAMENIGAVVVRSNDGHGFIIKDKMVKI